MQDPLPVWIAVGGTPQSVVRAGALGLPMALAIIGGMPERFAPFAELHRDAAAARPGHAALRRSSINSHGFIADTSQAAADESFPPFATMMDRIGRERGWPPMSRASSSTRRAALRGANFVGSPQEVVEKILFQHEIFGHDRFLLQSSVGTCRTRRHARDRAARHRGGARRAPGPRRRAGAGRAGGARPLRAARGLMARPLQVGAIGGVRPPARPGARRGARGRGGRLRRGLVVGSLPPLVPARRLDPRPHADGRRRSAARTPSWTRCR